MLDIAITEKGDFSIANLLTKDFLTIDGDSLRVQMAMCRIKSIKKDWYIDHIGSDLEEIFGFPNNVDTQRLGASKIFKAITIDELFDSDEIYIVGEGVNNTGINYKVYLKNKDEDSSTLIEVELDLVNGINIKIGEE